MINMGMWQIIYIGLGVLGLGIHLAKHGEQRTDKYSAWTQLFSMAIGYFILFKGGFFS